MVNYTINWGAKMTENNKQTDREFYEGMMNMLREQTYTYILDVCGDCNNFEEVKEKLKKELIKIHNSNIENTKKQINVSP
jgi:hypothetical protein